MKKNGQRIRKKSVGRFFYPLVIKNFKLFHKSILPGVYSTTTAVP
jgi:hypothetical protein